MVNSPWILGISASHNGAACLLKGDSIVVAVQEERLTRHKRHRVTGAKPALCVAYCLDYAKIDVDSLDMVVLGCQEPIDSIKNDLFLNPQLRLATRRVPALYVSHHLAHAVSAYATSGFNDSAILVVDGMGSPWQDLSSSEQSTVQAEERGGWESISLYTAERDTIAPIAKHLVRDGKWYVNDGPGMPRFGTLGGMFSAVAKQIFDNHMEAGKVMGLAAYGVPEIATAEFFVLQNDRFEFADAVCERFKQPIRWPHMAAEYKVLAASAQAALEDALIYLVSRLRDSCSSVNLCYTGGVALNSVANERLVRESGYEQFHFFPAAEDSGVALGAAFYGLLQLEGSLAKRQLARDSFGCRYDQTAVVEAVARVPGLEVRPCEDPNECTAEMLADGKVVGWFEGGSELGPRALGQRSILFDPRRPDGKDFLNRRVKRREEFRPYAPACLAEYSQEWFDLSGHAESPFMMRTCKVNAAKRQLIPAVVHLDGTARVQTLTKEHNGSFYDVVFRFYKKTGVPLVLNTSFNVAGEPLVESPDHALWSLLGTELDACIIERTIVVKKDPSHGLLDLYPKLEPRQVSVTTITNDLTDANRQGSSGDKYFSVFCKTPWGEFERFFPWSETRILTRIDGVTSGREILKDLSDQRVTLSEFELTRILAELAYAQLVSFAETPWNQDAHTTGVIHGRKHVDVLEWWER